MESEKIKKYIVNPLTKRNILIDGPTYKNLVKKGIIKKKEEKTIVEKINITLPKEISKKYIDLHKKSINGKYHIKSKEGTFLLDILPLHKKETLKELDVQVRVKHPNIMIPHEMFISNDADTNSCNVYRIIPFVETTLADVQFRSYKEQDYIEWMYQLLCAMYYLHENFIIMMNFDLQDIYMNSYMEGGKKRWYPRFSNFKHSILFPKQTYEYTGIFDLSLPPEIFTSIEEENSSFDEKVDIWTFGVMMHKLITGKPLFNEKLTKDEIYKQFLFMLDKDNYDALRFVKSSKIRHFLRRMLEVEPSKRASAEELLKDKIFDEVKREWKECDFGSIVYYKDDKEEEKRSEKIVDVLEWLWKISLKYHLERATWFLAVDIFDRFQIKSTENKLLYSLVCLWIASNLYDDVLTEEDIIKIYKAQQQSRIRILTSDEEWLKKLNEAKCEILKRLRFKLYRPTLDFLLKRDDDELVKYVGEYQNINI